jgi:hypothetical protein
MGTTSWSGISLEGGPVLSRAIKPPGWADALRHMYQQRRIEADSGTLRTPIPHARYSIQEDKQ